MRFIIEVPSKEIPQVINGVSANTIFYLINKEKLDKLKDKNNMSYLDMPYGIDDFSRCYTAYKTFDWKKEDFEKAIKNCKEMNLEDYFIKFLENFVELATLYETDQEKLSKNMKEIFSNGFWK